ncbi:MAG: Kelch repeat-containing protein [Polyangiales bacterium]
MKPHAGAVFLSILSFAACSAPRGTPEVHTRASALRAIDVVRASGLAVSPSGGSLRVRRASSSDAPVRLEAGDAWVEIAASSTSSVAPVDANGARVFVDAIEGTDIVHLAPPEAHAGRFEELRVVRVKSDSIEARWQLRYGGAIARARVRAGTIELLDGSGVVRLATAPLVAVDAAGVVRALEVEIADEKQGALVVSARLDAHDLAFPVVIDPAWSAVAPSTSPRRYHTLTTLTDGTILAVGGRRRGFGDLAERYTPATNTWAKTSAPPYLHYRSHSAVALPDGRALVAFGYAEDTTLLPNAEIYDSKTDTWTDVSDVAHAAPRADQTATKLADGRILFTGGYISDGSGGIKPSSISSIFDPSKSGDSAWVHSAKLMTGGSVGMLVEPRAEHTAVLLKDGNVMLFGGRTTTTTETGGAELFSPSGFASTAITPKGTPRAGHSASMLPSGKILFAGGYGASGGIGTSQIYDGTAFVDGPVMGAPRTSFASFTLPSGVTLFAGGQSAAAYLSTAEAYDPTENAFHPLPDLGWNGDGMALAAIDGSRVLVSGGGVSGGGGFYSAHTEADVLTLSSAATACTSNLDCASGHCVDKICCDSACTGNCEACDVAGKVGTCSAVSGAPHGAKPACMAGGADVCLTRTCNGVVRDTCSFVGNDTTCAAGKCEGATSAVSTSTCDGKGGCTTPVSVSCGDFQCRSGSCLTTCTSNDDCKSGSFCTGGVCRSASKCSDDRSSSIGEGGSHACAPNLCDPATGQCIDKCRVSDDCPQGSACDVTSGQCTANSAPSDSGGCSVPSSSPLGSQGVFAASVVALAAFFSTRRRRN